MSINWDIVEEQAKRKAAEYANQSRCEEGSVHWTNKYNGFYTGYVENASEREAFRQINENLRKELATLIQPDSAEVDVDQVFEDFKKQQELEKFADEVLDDAAYHTPEASALDDLI